LGEVVVLQRNLSKRVNSRRCGCQAETDGRSPPGNDVLATTTTDANGRYRFTQQSGPSGIQEIAAGVSATA
jgi:hypothetical protein